MKIIVVALFGMCVVTLASAETVKPEWSQDLMVKGCVDAVSEQVGKESQVGMKVRFDATKANAQMVTDDSFVCLVVGDRREMVGQMMKQERRVYSAVVQPLPKMKYRVIDIPLF